MEGKGSVAGGTETLSLGVQRFLEESFLLVFLTQWLKPLVSYLLVVIVLSLSLGLG